MRGFLAGLGLYFAAISAIFICGAGDSLSLSEVVLLATGCSMLGQAVFWNG